MEFLLYLFPIHMEIYNTLHQSNIIVVENQNSCGTKKEWDGWTMTTSDKRNPYSKTMLVMCTNTLKTNYFDWQGEIRRTLTHEAVHAAQSCKTTDGNLYPLGFRKDVEKEAVAIQDNPKEVLRILKKYCL